jgi:hypothetical protein
MFCTPVLAVQGARHGAACLTTRQVHISSYRGSRLYETAHPQSKSNKLIGGRVKGPGDNDMSNTIKTTLLLGLLTGIILWAFSADRRDWWWRSSSRRS